MIDPLICQHFVPPYSFEANHLLTCMHVYVIIYYRLPHLGSLYLVFQDLPQSYKLGHICETPQCDGYQHEYHQKYEI